MLKAIAVVVVILVAGLGAVLVYAATLPDEFRVQRRIIIAASRLGRPTRKRIRR